MLGLIQIINYMINTLEYDLIEIDSAFKEIENGDESIETLCDVLGIQLSPTMLQLATEKANKWESAYNTVKLLNK
jgi:hypothetical protein